MPATTLQAARNVRSSCAGWLIALARMQPLSSLPCAPVHHTALPTVLQGNLNGRVLLPCITWALLLPCIAWPGLRMLHIIHMQECAEGYLDVMRLACCLL